MALMAEVTAESPNTILPEELMIEILSRVELNNPLQLRCVCKLWNSLVVDPQFMKNHISSSITEITDLACKAFDRLQSLKSLQEEEGDEEDDEEAVEEEDNAADEDDDEEEDDDYDYDDDDDEEDVEEEEEEEEEEDVEEEQSVMDKIAEIRREEEVAPLDNLLKILKYIKGKFETIRDELQAVEDRVKCFQNFLLVCLKSAKSSSSQL